MDLTALATKMLEYAPAVAILMYLNWRADRTLQRVIEWCLRHINDDHEAED